ncbi:MAG: T9SS type A sorting domain-containing protein [Flavobacteriales bacterium]|nr:T9SS type A sorting domain-containing protein [Flavobacteriales bacterium]
MRSTIDSRGALMRIGGCTIAVLFSCGRVQAQAPGGVGGFNVWIRGIPSASGSALLLWTGKDTTWTMQESASLPELSSNYHPLLPLQPSSRHFALEDTILNRLSIFCVHPGMTGGAEKVVMTVSANDTNYVVLSDAQVGRVRDTAFIALPGNVAGRARLSTYRHNDENAPVGSYGLNLSATAPVPALQQIATQDTLLELIVHGRFLAQDEMNRISSYLAVKYGITKYEEDYVDGAGNTLWSQRKNEKFSSNIFGLGHDSLTLLDQRQATSTNAPGFLVAATGPMEAWNHDHGRAMAEGSYLLFGDNGASSSWLEREACQPQLLAKEWLVQRTGDSLATVTIQVDPSWIENSPDASENYWLVIDHGGQGNYHPDSVAFFQADPPEPERPLSFSDVVFDVDQNGRDRFKVAAGGSFIPKFWLQPPSCEPYVAGTAQVGIEGGEPPFVVQFAQQGTGFERTLHFADDSIRTVTGLPQGEIVLVFADASGYHMEDRLWVEATDAPVIPLAPTYALSADAALDLDAGYHSGQGWYEWMHNDTVIGNGRFLRVDRTGLISCTVNVNGCLARRETLVSVSSSDELFDLTARPNPSEDRRFTVLIATDDESDLTMELVSPNGNVMSTKQLQGSAFYSSIFEVESPGLYMVHVTGERGSRTVKVIVL